MFNTYYKSCNCLSHGHSCESTCHDFSIRRAEDAAYWRGYHDAIMKNEYRNRYLPRTLSEEEILKKIDEATKPIEELRKGLGLNQHKE